MSYHDRKANAQALAAEVLSNHVMKDGLVRSFRFHTHHVAKSYDKGRKGDYPFAIHQPAEGAKFSPTGTYAFTLTWTPGQLVLTGDCDELTLTHYNAMPTFEEAIRWITECSEDFDYLLGKSSAQRGYDQEETFHWFKQMINEELFNTLLGPQNWADRKLARNFKRGQIHEQREWRRSKVDWESQEDWLEDRPSHVFNSPDDDAWHWWRKISEHASVYKEQFDITKAEDRKELLREIAGNFEDEHSAADFLWGELGCDDPNICRNYNWRAFFQIACIQHGCRLILDSGAI
ncbi:hypothetical protein [Mesorhizobium sp. M4B.F.Ca.ET.058.02.1.1]|uniref:hypothetical protein n=1 Tax=Mesorhizobium sp. M4B.F.Ca.ET.058.02.1.1 TaxID=2493675 RepID=UPI000F75EA12|nr:hypothetical protein [Mesorhizobium sp. M4B.F.Ca.ET.058.02.1.1]AZO48023.1 hypothetical protein EJ073_09480 [Mesorhizobium sp. M4B.F.Ca.ET.058.02.1.1]